MTAGRDASARAGLQLLVNVTGRRRSTYGSSRRENYDMTVDRALKALVRAIGAVSMLAIVAVFMPRAWMAAIHERVGLGPFPGGPIVEYLARSTSLFYAIWGGVLWVLGGDVRRHASAIMAVGGVMLASGAVLLAIDLRAAMPWLWAAGEGPFVMLMGAVLLAMASRVRAQSGRGVPGARKGEPS
jgi:hypothetical protein